MKKIDFTKFDDLISVADDFDTDSRLSQSLTDERTLFAPNAANITSSVQRRVAIIAQSVTSRR